MHVINKFSHGQCLTWLIISKVPRDLAAPLACRGERQHHLQEPQTLTNLVLLPQLLLYCNILNVKPPVKYSSYTLYITNHLSHLVYDAV